MTDKPIQTDTTTQPSRDYTSESTRRLVTLAEGVLGADRELSNVQDVLDQLESLGDSLSEDQQAQINELAELLVDDPEAGAAAKSLSQDGRFACAPSDDKMELRLAVHPPLGRGEPVAFDDVVNWLKQQRITRGLEINAVRMAVSKAADGQTAQDVVIVRGRKPQPGTPERVQLFARRGTDRELEPITDHRPADGGLRTCREGDVILQRHPATAGTPGYDALGQTLKPQRGQSYALSVGPNVEARDEQCIAKVGGVVQFDGHHLEVRRMLLLDQDLTAKAQIDFDGDIQIRAAVRSGAHVEATGDILVDGPVEAAHIESTSGDIKLKHGVAGQHEALIRAHGSITTRFAENATLFAGDDILVDIGALHSRLVAGRAIHMSRGRGQVIGGSAMAAELIELKQAGSTSGVATELSVGLSRQTMEAVGAIDEQIARLGLKQEQARQLADKIKRTVGDPKSLQESERKAYTSLRQVQLVCDVKIRTLTDQRDEVLADAARKAAGRIDVHTSIHPRVTIRIGDAELEFAEPRHRCRVVYNDKQQNLDVLPLR